MAELPWRAQYAATWEWWVDVPEAETHARVRTTEYGAPDVIITVNLEGKIEVPAGADVEIQFINSDGTWTPLPDHKPPIDPTIPPDDSDIDVPLEDET